MCHFLLSKRKMKLPILKFKYSGVFFQLKYSQLTKGTLLHKFVWSRVAFVANSFNEISEYLVAGQSN